MVTSAEQMFQYFKEGVVGTKEFRNWLAKVDPDFAEVRDSDVDNEIDRIARERAEQIRQAREQGLKLVEQDGTIKEIE